jgi:hypothetical protein
LFPPGEVIGFGVSQPKLYEFYRLLRGRDAFLRFLLKGVEHINRVAEAYGVNSTEGVPSKSATISKMPRPPKPFSAFAK